MTPLPLLDTNVLMRHLAQDNPDHPPNSGCPIAISRSATPLPTSPHPAHDRTPDTPAPSGADRVAEAIRVVERERRPDAVLAALAVLREAPDPAHRPALLRRYAYDDAKGTRRDQGGVVRAGVLETLRPLLLPADAPLLERAVRTYEYLYGESTGDLRAAGLRALDEVDAALAGHHAVRLLRDAHTSTMSGEPAVTAARVLARRGNGPVLYAYLVWDGERVPDVTAECLRQLVELPPPLLPELLERYRGGEDEIVLLGLFDLLLAHPAGAEHDDFVLAFLRETSLRNIHRYVATALLAERADAWRPRLVDLEREEGDHRKREALREALALR